MSQVSIIDIEGNNPEIPTRFNANVGFAIPIANVLEIHSAVVAAGSVATQTVGSGNTITTNIQISQAIASTDATKIGLSAFNSADFSVDANGFVSFIGSIGVETINGDSGSISGSIVTIEAGRSTANSGSSVGFDNSATTSILNVSDANNNTILGRNAGNASITGTNNTALGISSLFLLQSGIGNVSIGVNANNQLTTGFNNVSIGLKAALLNNSNSNVAIGFEAMANCVNGDSNVYIGSECGKGSGDHRANVFIGALAAQNVTASQASLGLGVQSLNHLTTGNFNTACGYSTLNNIDTGAYNTAIGQNAGTSATGSSSSNIYIVSNGAPESNTIRIGIQGSGNGQQNTCFIAGIVGVTTTNTQLVTINSSTGQLGVVNQTGFTWTDITGATQTISVENGYLTDRSGGVTYTLPSTASIGDTFKIIGKLGLTTITPNANQQILMGSASGTVGITGTAVGTNVGDSVTFICITSGASTIWRAESFVGNWTLN